MICKPCQSGSCEHCDEARCEHRCWGGASGAEIQQMIDDQIAADPVLRALVGETVEALVRALGDQS